jgi:hypothetical protein
MDVRISLRRLAPWLAWGSSLISWAGSAVLLPRNPSLDGVGIAALVIEDGAFVAIATLALLILRVRPGHPVGWAAMLAGVSFPLESFISELARTSVAIGAVDAAMWLAWVSRWIWVGGPLALPLVLLFYPDGELPSRRWRFVPPTIGVIAVISLFIAAVDTTPIVEFGGPPITNPLGMALPPVVELVGGIVLFALAFLPAVGAASLVPRYRRSSGLERQQMKLIAWVGAIALVYFGGVSFVSLGTVTDAILSAAFTAYVGLTLTAGIVRYRLFDIDRLISRTVSYGVVVGLLLALAFGLATAATSLLPFSDDWAVAGSTLVAVALFNPLVTRVRRWTDRRFNRTAYRAEEVLARLAAAIGTSVEIEHLTAACEAAVDEAFQPTAASIWLAGTSGARSERPTG